MEPIVATADHNGEFKNLQLGSVSSSFGPIACKKCNKKMQTATARRDGKGWDVSCSCGNTHFTSARRISTV